VVVAGRYDNLVPLLGREDIPASGFALYFDTLMDLLKPKTLAKSSGPKISVKVESGNLAAIKQGFAIADDLRKAGYIAELALGEEELSNLQWLLDIDSGSLQYTLTDRVSNKRLSVKSISEVLAILGGQGADKNSTA